ncbi:MAG: hypothetical protein DME20_02360 [Verrucomicrobia bacterium]|nr:MAG: hypothetical protein DME71_02565 [Verrucomicrobiota bacterium]PYK51243.1 MAG: hypothetical protein DME20_02360 [Verrucomicrobiota bacterium]
MQSPGSRTNCVGVTTRLSATTERPDRVREITQAEFDQLATFVAVAEELRMEPFLSEDNHERLVQLRAATGGSNVSAHFCHPAFLKSAIMPFRRLWLASEICAFESIRDLVFRIHPDQKLVESYRHWFYDLYSRQLEESADRDWANESRRDILDIWIYTQAAHAGKKQYQKGKTIGRFSLLDFDQWAERIGRERFEFLFRSSVRAVGYLYIQFLEKLAAPLFWHLTRKSQMRPGFEAAAALKYSPYPDPRYRITFDDVFWHLDKESLEETFDRLLARQNYAAMESFLPAYFGNKSDAIAAVCENTSFSAMIEKTAATLVTQEPDSAQLMCSRNIGWGASRFGAVKFEVYAGKRIRFFDRSEEVLAEIFDDFRKCLFEERRRQRRKRWDR